MNLSVSRLYQKLILDYPWLTLAVLLSGAVFFAWQARYFQIDASADSLLLEDSEDLHRYWLSTERYGESEILAITVTPHEDLFSRPMLQHLQSLRDTLKNIESVASVMSILDVPLLENVDQTSLSTIAKSSRTLEDAGTDLARAKKELRNSPLFKELLISPDAKTTALLLTMKGDDDFLSLRHKRNRLLIERRLRGLSPDQANHLQHVKGQYATYAEHLREQRQDDIERIRGVIAGFNDLGTLHLGGVPMIANDMVRFVRSDLVVFGVGVFVFLVAILLILFRSLHWVLLPLLSCCYAGVVMIGILGLVGWKVTVISSNFLALMLIITISMNIHLMMRYRQLRTEMVAKTHRALVFKTLQRMFWPCIYTTLTSIIGFSSLAFSGIKPVVDFGWMMSLGLLVTFITSFTLFPASLLLLQPHAAAPRRAASILGVDALLARITLGYGKAIITVVAFVTVIAAFGIGRLNVENSFVSYFSEDTELFRGLTLIDNQLGGTTTLDILLNLEAEEVNEEFDLLEDEDLEYTEDFEEKEAYWFTDYRIKRISEVHDFLDAIPEVGKVLSLVSLLRAGEVLNGGHPFDSLQRGLIYRFLPVDIKQRLLSPYVNIAHNQARISLRIRDSDPKLKRNELIERIETGLRGKLNLSDGDFEISGLLVLYNNMLQSLYQSQIKTLGATLVGIALMLLMLFRSLRLAVIAIMPNILAAVVILGFMGIVGISLDFMTITVAAIAIGISVDNAIHYIYRFREEFDSNHIYAHTVRICHGTVGRAMLYTSATVIVGFSVLMLSNFNPTIYFGVLIGLAMLVALLGSLSLLPLLIVMTKPFNQRLQRPTVRRIQ